MRRLKLSILVVLSSAAANPAAAGYSTILEAVPGHSGVTWFDLVAKAIPGIRLEGERATGELLVEIPHIGGEDYLAAEPIQVGFTSIAYERLEADGREHLLVLAGLDQESAGMPTQVLALFDAGLRYLDAVQVGLDRHTGFAEPAVLRIGPEDEAVATHSYHFNSSQGYSDTALLLVRDGRLQLIDTVFTFSDRTCTYEQQQTLGFTADQQGEGKYWPITASVREIRTVSNECEEDEPVDPPFSRVVSATYRWSASLGGYVVDSDALKELAELSSERF